MNSADPNDVLTHRPLLRGWIHLASFVLFALGAPILLVRSPSVGATLILSVYIASLLSLFGVSALFHRVRWSVPARRRMRRLDHSTIFVAIAGSYTAVVGLALTGTTRVVLLVLMWTGAAAGIAFRQIWLDAPKWAIAIPYIVVGWSALLVLPQLLHAMGGWGCTWLLLGGLCYTAGALAYSLRRPNPIPGVFGYHEVFHSGTFLGALCHYIVILYFALPVAALR